VKERGKKGGVGSRNVRGWAEGVRDDGSSAQEMTTNQQSGCKLTQKATWMKIGQMEVKEKRASGKNGCMWYG